MDKRVLEIAWMDDADRMVHQCVHVEDEISVSDLLIYLGLSPEVYQCAVMGRRVSMQGRVPEEGRLDCVRVLHLSPEEARQSRFKTDQSLSS